MSKKTRRHPKDRMIHIRLDNKTHRRLKIDAVRKDTTIQQLVENLILESIENSRSSDTGQ